ncbi:DUF669 domain-containing protein [Secundilactobacillus kimchicus]|uniref:DUF669 domain-containing protein n=1 Tax=Secundilactobacillus kimchicus TaxID=528209 RepID=UPI0024A9CA05|nr:DUF669 domain-containing protein [Secundilactobacillus kimchicus]
MADFLKTDYSNNTGSNYDPLPTGTYEMIINKVQETATKNGAESLQIDLLVRNDLDGVPGLKDTNAKFHNRHVFNDNWKRKATNQYDLDGFQYILQAAGVPEGTPVGTVDDFMRLINGAAVKVYVKQEENDYQGQKSMVNRVAPWNYEKTDFPSVQHQFKNSANKSQSQSQSTPAPDPFANSGDSIQISDEDIPF